MNFAYKDIFVSMSTRS